jgi:hypothetical protein
MLVNGSHKSSTLLNKLKLNRRNFIQNSIGLIGFSVLPNALIKTPTSEKESLKLIRQLKEYGEDELNLQLKRKFYKKWLKKEQQLTYLYISRPDSILLPPKSSSFTFFGTDTLGAKEKAKELSDEGFDTLIYRTSGTSATLLTHHLLNYPPEAIMFIVLHEMSHVHREELKLKIPYPAEESFGEFLGNYASFEFANRYRPEFLPAIVKQREIQEKIYILLKETEIQLQGIDLQAKAQRYKEVQKAMNELLKNANAFQKDRYNYDINHAYILRNRFYYKWYPDFKKIYLSCNSIPEMVNLYTNLPKSEAETSTKLKLLTKNK